MSIKGFNVNGTQAQYDYDYLDNKPTIPSASSANPSNLGTAAAGTSADYARADHVHKMPSASDVGALPTSTTYAATVCGKSGTVTLDASDVGALASDTTYVESVNSKTGVVNLVPSDIGAYAKPSGGIPKSDLASAVQTSLGKADTALQSAPVTSVNSKTGAVTLNATDVGALPSNTTYVATVNGNTGAVTVDAGIGYNSATTYAGNTVGAELADLIDKIGAVTDEVESVKYGAEFVPTNASFADNSKLYLEMGYVSAANGSFNNSSTGKYYRTQAGQNGANNPLFIGGQPLKITCGLDWLEYTCWSYDSSNNATHSNTNSQYILSTTPIFVPNNSTDSRFALSFRKTDTSVFTDAEIEAVQDALKFYHATDTTLAMTGVPADAKVAGDAITAIKTALETETKIINSTQLYFESGTIASSGAVNTTTTSKIRTMQGTAPYVYAGDFYECDDLYQIRIAIYTNTTMQSSSFVGFVNSYTNGRVYIPDTYVGNYAAVLIQKVGATSSDISADVPTIGDHIKHYSNRKNQIDINRIRNNVLNYTDVNLLYPYYSTSTSTSNGITFSYSNGIYHVSGTCTGATYKTMAQNTLDVYPFVRGKTYLATVKGNSGTLPVYLRLFKRVNGAYVDNNVFQTNQSVYFTMPDDAEGYTFRLYVYNGSTVDNDIEVIVTRADTNEQMVFSHNIAFFGDSITMGANGSSATEGYWSPYTIPQTVCNRIGVAYTNYGVSSMGYVNKSSGNQNAYDCISTTDLASFDTLVMCYGVNDGFQPIGNYDSTDETTCLGQFNKIVAYLGTNYPSLRIIVVAPFNGRNAGSFPDYWYGTPGSSAYSRGTLSNTLKQACEYYNIPYIEQKDSPINGYSIQTLIGTDGVHPNNAGYKALGGWLSGEISRLIG